jgi:hypothetical protein
MNITSTGLQKAQFSVILINLHGVLSSFITLWLRIDKKTAQISKKLRIPDRGFGTYFNILLCGLTEVIF